jgi:hypothetical protein
MTSFVLISDGVVIQKQPYPQDGFVEAPDDVVCGMMHASGNYSLPTQGNTAKQITEAPATLFGGPTLEDIFNGN